MTLMKRNAEWFPGFSGLFDDFFGKDFFPGVESGKAGYSVPAVNVKETAEAFLVDVAAPGLSKEDFKLELDRNVLIISAEKKEEKAEESKDHKVTRKEFNYQKFSRSFGLPEGLVDREQIGAKYENGILHVRLPKKQKEKESTTRVIDVG